MTLSIEICHTKNYSLFKLLEMYMLYNYRYYKHILAVFPNYVREIQGRILWLQLSIESQWRRFRDIVFAMLLKKINLKFITFSYFFSLSIGITYIL